MRPAFEPRESSTPSGFTLLLIPYSKCQLGLCFQISLFCCTEPAPLTLQCHSNAAFSQNAIQHLVLILRVYSDRTHLVPLKCSFPPIIQNKRSGLNALECSRFLVLYYKGWHQLLLTTCKFTWLMWFMNTF